MLTTLHERSITKRGKRNDFDTLEISKVDVKATLSANESQICKLSLGKIALCLRLRARSLNSQSPGFGSWRVYI